MPRHLPVIQNPAPEDDEAAARPRSHWVAIGAGLAFTIWLPLSLLAGWLGRMLSVAYLDGQPPRESGQAAMAAIVLALPVWVSFLLACLAAGGLVGRFGGRARRREAALAGLFAALLATLLAALGGAFDQLLQGLVVASVLAATGAGAGALGAHLWRKRSGAQSPKNA